MFRKKSKNFTKPLIFFKTINLKIRKPIVFLTTNSNKFNFFKFCNSIFILNKTLTTWLYWTNRASHSSIFYFFLYNIKKNKKYFSWNTWLLYTFFPLIGQKWDFYNFFFINNFLFNDTIIDFFKINNFKKINKTTTKSFFKIKNLQIKNCFIQKTKENYSLNAITSKFSLKRLRNVDKQNPFLIFSISKNVFNNKSSLNNYFKKYQTLAFQLSQRETISTKLLKFSKMSKKLDKFQFIIPKKINYLKKHSSLLMVTTLHTLNVSNQLNNFFFKKFYLKKIQNSQLSNKYKNCSVLFKIFKNSHFYSKKNTHAKFSLAIASFLSKINYFFTKRKKIKLITNFKNTTRARCYNFFFKKFNILNFSFFFSKPFFFKTIFYNNISDFYKNLFNFSKYFFKKQYQNFFFKNQNSPINNNVLPSSIFFYIYKKKILKLFQYDKFPLATSPFCINSIIRFFEHCSGKSVIFKINLHLNRVLSYYEKFQCFNWSLKIKIFRKMLGPRLFLAESLEILYLTFKLKDPFFLSNWLLGMMKKISFWKYRLFFRYLKYVLRFFFSPIFKKLDVKGIKFQLKGKISVAGNARTRTLLQKTGVTGHSSFNNKIVSELSLVPSFTGVMGLKVWIFF